MLKEMIQLEKGWLRQRDSRTAISVSLNQGEGTEPSARREGWTSPEAWTVQSHHHRQAACVRGAAVGESIWRKKAVSISACLLLFFSRNEEARPSAETDDNEVLRKKKIKITPGECKVRLTHRRTFKARQEGSWIDVRAENTKSWLWPWLEVSEAEREGYWESRALRQTTAQEFKPCAESRVWGKRGRKGSKKLSRRTDGMKNHRAWHTSGSELESRWLTAETARELVSASDRPALGPRQQAAEEDHWERGRGWPSSPERSSTQTLESPVVTGRVAERMIMNKN